MDPTARLDWAAIDALLGVTAATVLRHALQLVSRALRDEFRNQPLGFTRVSGGLARDETRDEIHSQPSETTEEGGRLSPQPPRDETDPPPRPP